MNKLESERVSRRIAVPEIAARLGIGRIAVYTMLEKGIIPGIRLGRRWIVTSSAYESWERSCGQTALGNDVTNLTAK